MGFAVVLLFALPPVVGFAVVGAKLLELALAREIGSSKAVARKASALVVGATVAAFAAWFVWVFFIVGDPG
jgi:hypothetical protein